MGSGHCYRSGGTCTFCLTDDDVENLAVTLRPCDLEGKQRKERRTRILVSILTSSTKAQISCSAVLTLLSENTWTLPPHNSFHPPTSSSSPRGTVGIPLLSLHQSCTLLGARSPQRPPRESTFHSFLKKMDGIYTVCYSDDCESILLKYLFRSSARSPASFGYLPTIPYLPVVFSRPFFFSSSFLFCVEGLRAGLRLAFQRV